MRIAVPYDGGEVFQHFGHAGTFKLYDVDSEGRVTFSSVMPAGGAGHGALAGYLGRLRVDTLICGGIGGGAISALRAVGIRVCAGVTGDADAAVSALVAGTLEYSDSANCSHHGQGEGHSCGEHSCGEHSCGEHTCGGHTCGPDCGE